MTALHFFIIIGVLYTAFFGMFIYKLWDPKWFNAFLENKLEDKDLFTRFIKLLIP